MTDHDHTAPGSVLNSLGLAEPAPSIGSIRSAWIACGGVPLHRADDFAEIEEYISSMLFQFSGLELSLNREAAKQEPPDPDLIKISERLRTVRKLCDQITIYLLMRSSQKKIK